MSHTRDAYVDSLLSEWARWLIGIASGEIGYPGYSIMAKVFEPTNEKRSYVVPKRHAIENTSAEQVNTALNELSREYPEYATAVHEFYLNRSRENDVGKISSRYHISPGIFMRRVRHAKLWLSGRLSAICRQGD